MSARPCFLVVDPEHAGTISTRKLVLETAKFNVITAYSCREGLELLDIFPRVSGVVLNAIMPGESCGAFFTAVRDRHPAVKRVLVGNLNPEAIPAEIYIESFAPAELLVRLGTLFPRESADIELREERLSQRDKQERQREDRERRQQNQQSKS